jgi:NADH dehydrogenase
MMIMPTQLSKPTKIVIVGGGAGGLELAAMLSKKLKKHTAQLTLIDSNAKHVWKPLLHEVATGTLADHEDELDYQSYASKKGFQFVLGKLAGIDRQKKAVLIAALPLALEADPVPARRIAYDILVIAIGSLSNDFTIPGVREHCYFLDNLSQAETVQQFLINKIIQQVQLPTPQVELHIAIIGAGATGVELAAEIHHAINQHSSSHVVANHIHITLIEAQNRIVPFTSARVSAALTRYLTRLGIEVMVGEQVSAVTKDAFHTRSNRTIPADIKIWSAGIKGESILTEMDGLETNAINQLIVKPTLQTTQDDSIFALGDCASLMQSTRQGKQIPVPPSAQAAHQEACYLAKSIVRMLKNKPLLTFKFHNYGAFITVSQYNIVGSIMGKFVSSIYLEGKLARLVYFSIHKKHQIALHGFWRVMRVTLANWLRRKGRARLKLHY